MALSQTDGGNGIPIIFGAIGDKLDRLLLIKEAIWTGCDTAGDTLIVSDYDSNHTLYTGLGEANADKVLVGLRGQRVDGIKVTDMSSGQLLIYL